MSAFAIEPPAVTPERVIGRVLCHDVIAATETGRTKLPKGRILEMDDVPALRAFEGEIHLLEMEDGDIHEDEASSRLARAVAGPGLCPRGPVESQTQLRAEYRGMVCVRADALRQINALPDMSVYSLYDGQPVEPAKAVAATKVTPLVVPSAVVCQAEAIAGSAHPVLQVLPYSRGSVGVVVRDRLAGRGRDRLESALHTKVSWFGSEIAQILYPPDSVDAIADAIRSFVAAGVVLILAAGVNSTDPLDLTLQALERAGAVTERRGVPAHPGSTCWLAYAGDIPVFGLALCGMFSRTTVLDLLLPRFLAGQKVRAADISEFGHGGMLGKDMSFRFPDYEAGSPPSYG